MFKTIKQTDTSIGETAGNSNIPVELLKELATKGIGERAIAARNPNTPPEVLEWLSEDYDSYDSFSCVRAGVAANSNTSRHTLAMLAEYPNSIVRAGVAGNPHTSRHTLEKLAKDPDSLVLKAVAANPNISRHTLDKLSKNPHWFVQLEVAKNPNTSQFTLTRLAENPFGDVSRAAKANPNITKEEIERLAKYVEIYDNIETLFRKIKDIFVDIGYSLADLFLDKGYIKK